MTIHRLHSICLKYCLTAFIKKGIEDASDGEDIPEQFQLAPKNKIGGAIDLPSMKESVTRKKARSTSSTEQQQSEGDSAPEKIKRSNIQIFNKVSFF